MGVFGSSKKSSSSGSSSASQPTPRATAGKSAKATTTSRPVGPFNVARAAREMAAEDRRARSAALAALEPGALYIILYYREGRDNDFHWALYHHIDESVGGWKYHIVGSGGHWYPDHGDGTTTEALTSNAPVGLVLLKNVGVDQNVVRGIQRWITAEDAHLAQINGLTCRVYVGRACERLKTERIVDFSSWEALQTEVFAFGNRCNKEFVDRKAPQPRPIIRSAVAK